MSDVEHISETENHTYCIMTESDVAIQEFEFSRQGRKLNDGFFVT
jgi:hypothetical protein